MKGLAALAQRLFCTTGLDRSGCVTLRPIRPHDADALQRFVRALSPASRRSRFHAAVNELSETMLNALTCVDQCLHVAFVLTVMERGTERIVGEARYAVSSSRETAEFGLAVADAFQGRRLADRLVTALLDAAQRGGLRWLVGEVLAGNSRMLGLMRRCGFFVTARGTEPGIVRVERSVDGPAPVTRRAGLAADRSCSRDAAARLGGSLLGG